MRPSNSWPNSACGGTPISSNMARWFSPGNRGPAGVRPAGPCLLLDQRALAFIERAERLFGGDGGACLVVIPGALALLGLLYFEQVHVVDLAAVLPDAALAKQLVVVRLRLPLAHPGGTVGVSLQFVQGLGVVQTPRIHARLYHGRH